MPIELLSAVECPVVGEEVIMAQMSFGEVVAASKAALLPRIVGGACERHGYDCREPKMAPANLAAAVKVAEEALAEGGRVRVRKDRAIITDPANRGAWWRTGLPAAVFFF